MLELIERILEEKVRPQLADHGGDIKSISCEKGIYRFRLLGRCSGCPSAYLTTESRLRILRLIENLCLGTAAVGYRTESMHGAGSPQAQRIMIARQGNLEHKKELAKAIAHIQE